MQLRFNKSSFDVVELMGLFSESALINRHFSTGIDSMLQLGIYSKGHINGLILN